MQNKAFDAVVKAICSLIEKEGSGDVYSLNISKNRILKNIPKQEVIDSLRRLESLGVICDSEEPARDAEPGTSFISDDSTNACFYAGQEGDFESWRQKYERQNKTKLADLPRKTAQEIMETLDEIYGKIKLQGDEDPTRIKLPPKYSASGSSILSFLFSKHAIHSYRGSVVRIGQNYIKYLLKLRQEIKDKLQSSDSAQGIDIGSHQNDRIVYTLSFTQNNEILINDIFFKKPHFDGENSKVLNFLIKNPNKMITKKKMVEEIGSIGKELRKIIENLGFSKDYLRVFFQIKKDESILFRNPIYLSTLQDLKIRNLALKTK